MSSADRISFRITHPMRRTEAGGLSWDYWCAGKGPRGLLLLGGMLSFGDSAHALISAFESTRKVLSPSYPQARDVIELADALPRLLDVEGLQTVDVFGYGLGAGVAHLLARLHPQRVGRLALSGFGLMGPFRAAAQRARVKVLERLPGLGIRAHCMQPYQRLAQGQGSLRTAEILTGVSALLDRHTRSSALRHLQLKCDLFRGDTEQLRLLPSPARTLLLLADDDPWFTRHEQDRLEETYPRRTVVRYVNAGRMLTLSAGWDLERKLDLFFGAPAREESPVRGPAAVPA